MVFPLNILHVFLSTILQFGLCSPRRLLSLFLKMLLYFCFVLLKFSQGILLLFKSRDFNFMKLVSFPHVRVVLGTQHRIPIYL